MRIGIFGGSFDPVHLGHIWMARSVANELELDKLFMVVAAAPPHKAENGRLPGNIRLRMVEAAVNNEPKIIASDIELKREGKSYTVDTVDAFRRQYRGAKLFFIVGGDMLENFPAWREPARILSMANLVAVTRPDERRDMRELADSVMSELGGRVLISSFTGPDISSTEVRRRMSEALPVDTMVARPTELFMYENALYMPQEITDIRARLSGVLKKRRLTHTMLTCCEAVKLAYRYGVDTKKARLAALLHDCIKLPNRELIEYCEKNCFDISEEERANPYLIHSRLGAVLAETEYGAADPEVIMAIRSHTLGRIGMSMLEKVIYVADKIEPTRDYDGLDDIRELAYEDIDKAMLRVMQHSAEYTAASGRTVNPSTGAVMDHLKEEIIKKEIQ